MFSCICHDSRIAPPMFHTEACTNVAGGECVCVCGGGGGGAHVRVRFFMGGSLKGGSTQNVFRHSIH